MQTPAFDILQVQDGGVSWVGSALTLEEAQEHVREIAASAPGKYLLLNQQTGTRLVMKFDGNGAELASESQNTERFSMNEARLKFPEWQGPLEELILEFDPQKRTDRIQSVETLVLKRLEQLDHGNDGLVEKTALHDALSVIRIIKRDRLGSSGPA